jgi:PIN domain nuclease of toxin-antitoxin system
VILLDTHVIVWFMQADPRLGGKARSAIETARRGEGIGISAITPWEIAMLAGKGRLSLGRPVSEWVRQTLEMDGISLAPLDPVIAVEAGELAGLHGDPADRIIIATARYHDAALVTADRIILDHAAAGHVQAIDAGR